MVTPLYAALLGLVFIALSVRTLRLRRRHKTSIGMGEVPELQRAMRAHANFAEYVPLTLILLMFLEMYGTYRWIIHALGALLLVGRMVHAYGVSQVQEDYRFRVSGMAMTFTALGMAALGVLAGQLSGYRM